MLASGDDCLGKAAQIDGAWRRDPFTRREFAPPAAGSSPQFSSTSDSRTMRPTMTYCVGILTEQGLVMASDSRSNAGYDQVNVCRKMHTFVRPGERVFIVLASGSLSLTQSILTMLRRDFEGGKGLASAPSMYDAARVIGEQVRRISDVD